MKTCIHRVCTLALLSLLGQFGFEAQAVAQVHTLNQPVRTSASADSRRADEPNSEAKAIYSTLYNFCSVVLQNGVCGDGSEPAAGLIQDAAGNLYGTTWQGGDGGVGTVFKLSTTGQETVLYSFCPAGGMCADGSLPQAGLI